MPSLGTVRQGRIIQMQKCFTRWLPLIIGLLCSFTVSAHDFEVNGIYYNITSSTDLTVEVTYRGNYYSQFSREYTGVVTIPETVTYRSRTYRVTSIGGSAFNDCSSLTSIVLPEGVTSIGGSAFNDCSSLSSITIPESVTSIGVRAFDGTPWYNNQPDGVVYACNVLYKYKGEMPENTSIEVRKGTVSVSDESFYYCRSLTSITIPENVTSIGNFAFGGCSSLTSIVLPEGVTSIGGSAFYDCSSLSSISIPESVTVIGNDSANAFAGCSSLTSIVVEGGNMVYDSRNECNAIIETNTNTLIIGCASTIIPEGVTSIGNFAFEGCSSLSSISIPESVTSIGYRAFYACI